MRSELHNDPNAISSDPSDVIERVEIHEFRYEAKNLHFERENKRRIGMLSYRPNASLPMRGYVLAIETAGGLRGEFSPYMGGTEPAIAEARKLAPRLIGQNPFAYEQLHGVMKIAARAGDGAGVGLWDIALWDLMGKAVGKPIYALLGGGRTRLPTYVTTWRGDRADGLDSPDAFVAFAKDCHAQGAQGFKVHSWPEALVEEECRMVAALGEGVGGKMALMLDPACVYRTFSDTLRVGRACDAAGFLWLEDPMVDIGRSFHAHRMLREKLRTEIVMGERLRGLEEKANMIIAGAADRVRTDPEMDLGITGVLKVAHLAEAFGLDVDIANCSPAQRHCVAAIRNSGYYEICNIGPDCPNATPPIYVCGYEDQISAIGEDGCVATPTGPGLGVVYDWDFINANRLAVFELDAARMKDVLITPQ